MQQRSSSLQYFPIAIVGSTGTGKSEAAVQLALDLQAAGHATEIINADSMQFYRGMDIGTAKIKTEEMQGVAHHFLDVLDITDPASAAWYQEEVSKLISDLLIRNTIPLIVGGSGLYIRAALDTLDFPPMDSELRKQIESEAFAAADQIMKDDDAVLEMSPVEDPVKFRENIAREHLLKELRRVDPVSAGRHLDFRRVVRALEVYRFSGRSFSSYMPERQYKIPAVQYGLSCDRNLLRDRLGTRVDQMLKKGLVNEVIRLQGQGLESGPTARHATGYAQFLDAVNGKISYEQAREKTIVATHQLARRQRTWFGADSRIQWFDVSNDTVREKLTKQVYEDIQNYTACFKS